MRVHYKYLFETNTDLHDSQFTAIAELLDNSYDHRADCVEIDFKRINNQDCLIIVDTGDGLSKEKMCDMMSLGFSEKPEDTLPIGKYGTGFKHGAAKLGYEIFVFSQENPSVLSVGFLSKAFNVAKESVTRGDTQIPIASWSNGKFDDEQALAEILQHNLIFKTDKEILDVFYSGSKTTDFGLFKTRGTVIVIYDLKKAGNRYQLDFDTNKDDIRLKKSEKEEEVEGEDETCYSLREYLSSLYLSLDRSMTMHTAYNKNNYLNKIKLRKKDIEKSYSSQLVKIGIYPKQNTKAKERVTIGIVRRAATCGHLLKPGLLIYHENRLIERYHEHKFLLPFIQLNLLVIVQQDFLKPLRNKQKFEKSKDYDGTKRRVKGYLDQYVQNDDNLRKKLEQQKEDEKEQMNKRKRLNDATVESAMKSVSLPIDNIYASKRSISTNVAYSASTNSFEYKSSLNTQKKVDALKIKRLDHATVESKRSLSSLVSFYSSNTSSTGEIRLNEEHKEAQTNKSNDSTVKSESQDVSVPIENDYESKETIASLVAYYNSQTSRSELRLNQDQKEDEEAPNNQVKRLDDLIDSDYESKYLMDANGESSKHPGDEQSSSAISKPQSPQNERYYEISSDETGDSVMFESVVQVNENGDRLVSEDFPKKSLFNLTEFVKRGEYYEKHANELKHLLDELNYYFDNSKYQGEDYTIDYRCLVELFSADKKKLGEKFEEIKERKFNKLKHFHEEFKHNRYSERIEKAVKLAILGGTAVDEVEIDPILIRINNERLQPKSVFAYHFMLQEYPKLTRFHAILEHSISSIDFDFDAAIQGKCIERAIIEFVRERNSLKLIDVQSKEYEFKYFLVVKYKTIEQVRNEGKCTFIIPQNANNPAMDFYYYDKNKQILYCFQVTVQNGNTIKTTYESTCGKFEKQFEAWKRVFGDETKFSLVFITWQKHCDELKSKEKIVFDDRILVSLESFRLVFNSDSYNRYLVLLKKRVNTVPDDTANNNNNKNCVIH